MSIRINIPIADELKNMGKIIKWKPVTVHAVKMGDYVEVDGKIYNIITGIQRGDAGNESLGLGRLSGIKYEESK